MEQHLIGALIVVAFLAWAIANIVGTICQVREQVRREADDLVQRISGSTDPEHVEFLISYRAELQRLNRLLRVGLDLPQVLDLWGSAHRSGRLPAEDDQM